MNLRHLLLFALTFGAILFPGRANADFRTGLIGYWPFDASSVDASGIGFDLTLYGGVGYAPGLFGQSLDLNRNTNRYAGRPGDDGAFDFAGRDFTAQVWARFDSTSGEQVLMEKFQGASGPGWTLSKTGESLHFYASPSAIIYSRPLSISTETWHQVVIRKDGPQFTLWYDGTSVASQTTDIPIPNTSFPLIVGKRNSSDSRGFPVEGQLDEVAIWNRPLKDAEIIQLYNFGAGTPVSGEPNNIQVVPLISPGSAWSYLDNGSDQGVAWQTPEFDDSGWRSGNAQLGYGDGDEVGVIDCGPGAPGACSPGNGLGNNYATTYFRFYGELQAEELATFKSMSARILRDDGAAVYVNGVQVYRDASLRPAALFSEFANFNGADSTNGVAENVWHSFSIDPTLFRVGSNVIAVEVHQHAPTSSDISFDFELTAYALAVPEPSTWALVVAGMFAIVILRSRR